MKKFTFDLQRFDWKLSTSSTATPYSTLSAALNAISSSTTSATIYLTASQTESLSSVTISKNITLNLGSYTLTASGTLSVSSGYTLTLSGSVAVAQNSTLTLNGTGTIRSGSITNNGTLNVKTTTVSTPITTSTSSVGVTIGSGVTATLTGGPTDSCLYKFGSNAISVSGTVTVTNSSDRTATVKCSSSSSSFTDYASDITCSGTGATFSYDSSGNIYATSFVNGGTFTLTDETDLSSTTFTVTDRGLTAKDAGDDRLKIWLGDRATTTSVSTETLMNSDNFMLALTVSDRLLEISTDALDDNIATGTDNAAVLVNASDFDIAYGTLTKIDDTTYALTKTVATSSDDISIATKTRALNGITVADGLTLQLTEDFVNVPITVNTDTTFKTVDATAFTVTSSNRDFASIGGATNVSLGTGTVMTAVEAQTIKAGSYKVWGYSSSEAANPSEGITVALDKVGDINIGESFYVNGTKYTREAIGLTTGTGTAKKVYTGEYSDANDYYQNYSVALASLTSANFSTFIQPEDGVLTLGGKNSLPAVVINASASGSTTGIDKFGELKINTADNSYTLTTIDGGRTDSFTGSASIATISVAGGNTTIDEELASGRIIVTKGTKGTRDGNATFTVQSTSEGTFTVNGSIAKPTVQNATEITLIDGTIITDSNIEQTVNFNGTEKSITVTTSASGMTIAYDSAEKIFTVTGAANDEFTLDGNNYVIAESSDGMTFAIDADGSISLGGLTTADKDVFTVGDTVYSVRGAGVIKTDSNGYSIWAAEDNVHTLTGGAVSYAAFANADNWTAVVTVDAENNSVTLPPTADFTGDSFLVGYDDFKNIYGNFNAQGSAYSVETVDATANLENVQFDSSGSLSMGAGLTGILIQSTAATLTVTDDAGDGYKISLTSGAGAMATVSDGESYSLTSGAVQANGKVTVSVTDFVKGTNIIAPTEGTTVDITADDSNGTIGGLSDGEGFLIGNDAYNMNGVVGLLNDNNMYLFGSKDGSVVLSDINTEDRWGKLVSASALVITENYANALVVDNASDPTVLYADYDAGTAKLSKSDGGTDWPESTAISLDNTTVNFTRDFANKKIYGDQSRAAFTVSDDSDFTVTDLRDGATISADNINQTGGLISVTADSQVLGTSAGTVTAAEGLTVFVSGNKTTVNAIEDLDDLKVNGATFTKEIVGFMDESDQILLNTGNATSIDLDSLTGGDWKKTDAVNNDVLTLPTATAEDEWIIIDSDKETIYGSLTSNASGSTISVVRNDNSFAIYVDTSRAQFTTDDNEFTVTDGDAATVASADLLNQTAGTIALIDTRQSIVGGNDNTIVAGGFSTDNRITVNISGTTINLGAIDVGESFTVDDDTYTLLSNNRFQRSSDSKLWNGDEISGTITVAQLQTESNWNSLTKIETDEQANLTITADAVSVLTSTGDKAFVVNKTSDAIIYGTLTRNDDSYTLSTDGKTNELHSVTVTSDVPKIIFKPAFVDLPISAEDKASFTVTTSSTDFTVNFDGTNTSVDAATKIELTSGTLTLSNANQVVTANDQTVNVVSGKVTVNLTDEVVTVDAIDTANESVKVNANTYTLTDATGAGFSIQIDAEGTTTIGGITEGDKFTINSYTFVKTAAGFTKIVDSANSYLWISEETEGSVDVGRLLELAEDDWLAIVAMSNDTVTITTDSKTSLLVDNITAPTKIYGQLTKNTDGSLTLTKETDADTDATTPTAITVAGATVTIDDDFNKVPITASNSATINTETEDDTLTFAPVLGNEFTVNDTNYKMTVAGLTNTDDKTLWTEEATQYVLPAENSWTPYLELDSSKKLDMSNATADGNYIVVAKDAASRVANLTASGTEYNFTAYDGATVAIATIALKSSDTTATVTADFETYVTTGDGVFTVNEKNYTGKLLTIATTIDAAEKSSTLYAGTVTIADGKSVTADTTITAADSSSITATAKEGKWDSLGDLNANETFTVDGTTYKVLDDSTLAKVDSSGEPVNMYTGTISSGSVPYSIFDDADSWNVFVKLDDEGNLDLTAKIDGTNALVVKVEEDGTITRVAALTYNSNAYTLAETSGGDLDELTGVTLGKTVPTFTTAIETTVTTAETVTVNDKKFAAYNSELSIATAEGSAVLTDGTVILDAGDEVTARRLDSTSRDKDETIKTTTGTLTVNVTTGTEPVITIALLDNADAFSVDDGNYIATSIGLATSDNAKLLPDIADTVTTAQIGGDDWMTVLAATDGALSIDLTATEDEYIVADLTDASNASRYGTLNKASGAYTLTLDSEDSAPTSIALKDVKATFPADCASAPITAGGGTFTVTATTDFTVDATSTEPMTFTNVDALEVTDGALTADTTSPPVSVDGRSVQVISGSVTVGIDEDTSKAYVGKLANDDEFDVNGIKYKMISGNLYTGDEYTQQVTTGYSDRVFTMDDDSTRKIIAVNGTELDLSEQTEKAFVYDSVTRPTTKLADLDVNGNKLTLNLESGVDASAIETVKVAAGKTLTVDFETQVSSPVGTVTVNGLTYAGTTALTLDTTADSSTLNTGTVALSNDNKTVNATNETNPAVFVNGNGFNVTADSGTFIQISGLDAGDKFTLGGATYTQAAKGLVNADGQLAEDLGTSGTITVDDIDTADWADIIAPTSTGVLNIAGMTDKAIVYDSATSPATKLATLTVEDGTLTLSSEPDYTSGTIATVRINAGEAVKLDFAANVAGTAAGNLTVNGMTYTGTTALTVATDGTDTTLFAGTVTIAQGETVTADRALECTSGDGITAKASNGAWTEINGVANDESFTLGGTTYTQSAQGLMTGNTICENLSGSTISISKLDAATFVDFIYPTDGTLELTNQTSAANVYDSATPTTKLGTLTVDDEGALTFTSKAAATSATNITAVNIAAGTNITVDFATTINAPIGTATVNGNEYTGTTALTIAATASTSTLTEGTVTLAAGDSVTPTDNDTITATSEDGITVKVASDAVTISGLADDDEFTVGSTSYKIAGGSLYKVVDGAQLIYTGTADITTGITLEQLAADDWGILIEIDGNLTIPASTDDFTDALVVNKDDVQKVYGRLTKGTDSYTLSKTVDNEKLTSITVTDTTVVMDADFASVPLTAGSAVLSAITTSGDTFTVDAATPALENVSAFTLTSGTVTVDTNQTVTTGTNVLTPTSGTVTVNATTISSIDSGDAFTLNDKAYTLIDNVGLFNSTDKTLADTYADGSVTIGGNETQVLAPNSSGVLDVSTTTDDINAIVLDSTTSPTTKLGTLTKTDSTYTVDFETKLKTPAGTVTVNSATYNGTTILTLATTATVSTLYDGTVSLANNESVDLTDGDNTRNVEATAGDGISVKVSNGGDATILGELDSNDTFKVDSKEYQLNSAGLYRTADNKMYSGTTDVLTDRQIRLDELDSDDVWSSLLNVPSTGVITIEADTLDSGNALLVSSDRNTIYGLLTKTDSGYTLTKPDAANGTPTSITVTGTTVEFAAAFKDIALVANSTDITDIALGNTNQTYTLNATDDPPSLSDNATSFTLGQGSVTVNTNQTVTTGTNVFTPTTGTLTVNATTISGINSGDAFTLNDKAYTLIANVGLFNSTDKTLADTYTDGSVTIGGTETQAIAPTDGVITLPEETSIALDSLTAPKTKLGTVTVSGTTYTVDFAAKVLTPDKTVTVNGTAYNGTALTLDTTTDASTLNTGSVTLAAGESVNATTDGQLTVNGGELTAAASDGKFTTLSGLESGNSFSYGGDTYTQTDLGLMNSAGQVREDLAGDTIDMTQLSGGWAEFLVVEDETLTVTADTLATVNDTARLVDKDHTKIYGTLTKTDTASYTLTDADESLSAINITGAAVVIDKDFAGATVTANTNTVLTDLAASGDTFTVDATSTPTLDGVTSFTLDGTGSVVVNANQTVTTGTNSITPTSGTVTVNATTISDIAAGDAFTLNDKAYTLIDGVGLFNATDKTIADCTDGAMTIGGDETPTIAPTDGVITLPEETSIVLDSLTAPTEKLGTVTVDGTTYTVDFAATVSAPIGTATVNGQTYNGTTALTLATTSTTATLTAGTVTLAAGDSVTTTSSHTVNATSGDGLTVTATDSAVTLSGLTSGDAFTVDGTNYQITDAALYKVTDSGKAIYNGSADVFGTGITVDQLAEDVWGGISTLDNDTVIINDSTLTAGTSNKLTNEDGSKVYGTLTRDADGNYTLTKTDDTNADLAAIKVQGVVAKIDSDLASVPVTTTNSDSSTTTFTATPASDAEYFTVDATGNAPVLENVSAVELTEGSLTAEVDKPVTLEDGTVVTPQTKGFIVSADGISGLTEGATFDVDGDTYKVLDNGSLYNATDKKIVTGGYDGDTLTFADIEETQIITQDSKDRVDLSELTSDGTVLVYDDEDNPTTQLGSVTKDGTAYTVDFSTKIKASAGTFTLNDKTYTARSDVTISVTVAPVLFRAMLFRSSGLLGAGSGSEVITEGSVELTAGGDVSTATTGNGNTFTATSGTILVTVVENDDDTVSELKAGDAFNMSNTSGDFDYYYSAIGLMNTTDGTLRTSTFTNTITATELADTNWAEVLEVADGALTVDTSTLTSAGSVILVDSATDPTVIYGTLTFDGTNAYTLTVDNATADLESVAVDGVVMNIPGTLAAVPITANTSNIFIVTPTSTSSAFTVDATGTPALTSNVSAVTLTAGSITATANQSVTVDDNTITPTTINGTMVIGTDNISGLTAGDKFTVDDTTYTLINGIGLFDTTDGALVTSGYADGTFAFDNAALTAVIAPTSGTLDLSDVAADVLVFDSVTAPTTNYGTVTVATDGALTFNGTDDAPTAITTVSVAADSNLTVDFATIVSAPIGTVTVNSVAYDGTTALTLTSDGTTSTLTSGTVALALDEEVTTTPGNVIKATGTATDTESTDEDTEDTVITVTVNGTTVTINELSTGDVFTVDGAEYKVSTVGPMNPDGDLWTGDKAYTSGLTLTELATADNWTPMLEVDDGGILTVDSSTLADGDEVILVDDADEPTATYGALVKVDGAYALATDDTSTALNGINVNGVIMNIDGALAAVPVTANDDNTFTVTPSKSKNPFTVDAVEDIPALTDNVKAVTLTAGSIVANLKQPVTVGEKTITATTITDESTMTIGVDGISGLAAGDTFTVDGDTYTLIDGVGLFNSTDKALVTEGYADGTFDFNNSTEAGLLAPKNGILDLTGTTTDAIVYDSITAPTTTYGTISADSEGKLTFNGTTDAPTVITTANIAAGSDWTIDFATTVSAPIGTATVNGQEYTGTTALTIASDGTTSTLTNGTVSVAAGSSVTPTGQDTVTATAGDGLTVNVNGSTVTINAMNDGDTFTVGSASYKVTAVGPVNASNQIWTGDKDYISGLTVEDLANADNWSEMISAADGALTVKADTLSDGDAVVIVDSTKTPTKTYGTLTKAGDGYTLTKEDDDEALSSITDNGTVVEVDNDLAGVPVTTVTSDGDKATFTVAAASDTDYYTVDATGTTPKVDDAASVEVSSGKISAGDGIPVTAAEDAEDVDIAAGNGTHDVGNKTVTIAGLDDEDTVDFGTDIDGNLNSVSGLTEGSTVTVDGKTYTAPADDSTLAYNSTDGWYFDGYTLDEYTVTVDSSGNVSVDDGVQFSLVVASGKTLDDSGTIKFAANIAKTPVTVINNGTTALNLSDNTGDALASNLGQTDGVKFSDDTTTIDSLKDVAGATFTLERDKVLTGSDATITSGADSNEVLVSSRGKVLDVSKAATVNAPAATELELGNATYNLNGVTLTTSDGTNASLTSDGASIDLASNDALTYSGMTLSAAGTATFDSSGNISLTSGAVATNATGKALTIDGTVDIDGKTVNVATATKVTATANGLNVGDETLSVTGDTDGYTINISASSVTGLEDIGSTTGVTVSGLDNATINTDKNGNLTVDRTFNAPSNVTYTVEDGKLVSVADAETISGNFAGGLNVNGTDYTVAGGTATIDSDGDINTGAGTFTINGHIFTTSTPATFTTSNASVTGADMSADGTFAVHQDETNFALNGDNTLTFSGNGSPVTVGTASGIVTAAYGVDGLLNGLVDAVVYDVSSATINGTPIDIDGSLVDVPVEEGTIETLYGLDSGATVNTAPLMTLQTEEDGTFQFVNGTYNVTDTDDGIVNFITDANSRVINIDGLSGILSGSVGEVTVNGQAFASTSEDLVLATDGTDITAVAGLSDGTAIAGSLSKATIALPEGSVTINGAPYTVVGSDDITLSDDGTVVSGLSKDSTLTVGVADTYNINGKDFVASAGQAYTANNEGVYAIDPNFMPITESTDEDLILALGASSFYVDPTMTGSQSAAFTSGNNIALIDSPYAPTTVTTGTGKDSVVARHGAQVTADVAEGTPVILATDGNITLDNYDDNADIQTFDYTNIADAIMNNDIKFGDGTMTIGDAVITFDPDASSSGGTVADIIGAGGDTQAVGFTHTDGGTLDTSDSTDPFVLKGNYAQSSSDTQKSDGSSITAGKGNDTVLVGANDTVDAGAGSNQIYITDPSLRNDGATIALTAGNNTVNGFNPGFTAASDAIRISDPSALEFGFGDAGLTMSSGNAKLTFADLAAPTVTVASSDDSLDPAAPYELKITDGTTTYNAAIAQDGKDLAVEDNTAADVFIGDDTTGLSFDEYTGTVAVNLSDNEATLNGSAAQIYGVNKVELGSGNSTLIGAENTNNTLIAGTGNGSIWSDSGNDIMKGNTSDDKNGSTAFFFTAGDGHDTIRNFDFVKSTTDNTADEIVILPEARVTAVNFSGDDVVISFNDNNEDNLTIEDANDNVFRVNGMITKVDDNIEFDGFTECYVGIGDKPTLTVGEGMGDVDIFLGDDEGTQYLSDIAVLDASAADGEMNFLAGNDTDNLIIGGQNENAIWGGDGFSNDTLVGGGGKNTFFFAMENGNDIIQNAKDGDVVDLTYLDADQFASLDITSDGVAIDLTDGSRLEVQSNAAVEYKLGDGNTYLADHSAGEFNRKETNN